jgi:hypothetical protein
LLPFDFLAPSGEQETTRLTLDGIQGPDTQRRIAEVSPISADGKLASYKGGKYRNLDSTFTIRFGDSPAFLPARIVRTLSSGLVDGEIDFVSYEPVECGDGAVYLPKQIEMHTRGIGVDFGTFTFTMTEAELNKPIAPEIFTIDFQTVRLTHNMDHDDLGPMYPATNTSASATAASQPASAPGAGIAKNQDDAAPSELLRYGGAATVILGLLMLISIAFSMSRRNRQPEGR